MVSKTGFRRTFFLWPESLPLSFYQLYLRWLKYWTRDFLKFFRLLTRALKFSLEFRIGWCRWEMDIFQGVDSCKSFCLAQETVPKAPFCVWFRLRREFIMRLQIERLCLCELIILLIWVEKDVRFLLMIFTLLFKERRWFSPLNWGCFISCLKINVCSGLSPKPVFADCFFE